MSNKKKDNTIKTNVEQILKDAEFSKDVLKDVLVSEKEKTQDAIKASYEAALAQLTEEHREKGSLAFELLKYAVSSRTESLNANSSTLQNLVESSFILADSFKNEMGKRWAAAFKQTAEKFNPNLTVLDNTQPTESEAGKLN